MHALVLRAQKLETLSILFQIAIVILYAAWAVGDAHYHDSGKEWIDTVIFTLL